MCSNKSPQCLPVEAWHVASAQSTSGKVHTGSTFYTSVACCFLMRPCMCKQDSTRGSGAKCEVAKLWVPTTGDLVQDTRTKAPVPGRGRAEAGGPLCECAPAFRAACCSWSSPSSSSTRRHTLVWPLISCGAAALSRTVHRAACGQLAAASGSRPVRWRTHLLRLGSFLFQSFLNWPSVAWQHCAATLPLPCSKEATVRHGVQQETPAWATQACSEGLHHLQITPDHEDHFDFGVLIIPAVGPARRDWQRAQV